MADLVEFTAPQAVRIIRAVKRLEADPVAGEEIRPGKIAPSIPRSAILRVTSTTTTDGMFPARIQSYAPSGGGGTFSDIAAADDAWIKFAGSGTPAVNDRLHCQFLNIRAADNRGVWVAGAVPGGTGGGGGSNIPTWVKVTKGFADWSSASSNVTITVRTLGAREWTQAYVIKHSAAFTGAGVNSATATFRFRGNNGVFLNVFQAPGNDVFNGATLAPTATVFSFGSGALLEVNLQANVALNNLTTGSLDVYMLLSTLP